MGYCLNNGSILYLELGNLTTDECSYYLQGSIPRPTGVCDYEDFYSARTGYYDADGIKYVCYNEEQIAVNTYDSEGCSAWSFQSSSIRSISNDGDGSKCVYGFKWNSYTNEASLEEIQCDYVRTERAWLTTSTTKNEETESFVVNQCVNNIMYGCNSTRYWKGTYSDPEDGEDGCKEENIQKIEFYPDRTIDYPAEVQKCTKESTAPDITKYANNSKLINSNCLFVLICLILVRF